MEKKFISVTDAARNFSDCVNRVHYQNVTFVLLKNGVPFARLAPEQARVRSGREVAEVLRKGELPERNRAGVRKGQRRKS